MPPIFATLCVVLLQNSVRFTCVECMLITGCQVTMSTMVWEGRTAAHVQEENLNGQCNNFQVEYTLIMQCQVTMSMDVWLIKKGCHPRREQVVPTIKS